MLVTRDDLSANRQTKTLDELLPEIEQLSQERASRVSVESDDEEETCLLQHEPGKAVREIKQKRLLGIMILRPCFFLKATGPRFEALVSLIFLVWLVVKT